MLPKKERVTKKLFLEIMKYGKTTSGSFFLLRYVPTTAPHYAVVAPKSIAKKASKRIALRRAGYNTLRMQALPSVSGIFFYKKGAQNASREEISLDMTQILLKL
jgi:RNase P protein component